MGEECKVRARVCCREIIVPAWVRELCGWSAAERLYFRVKDYRTIEVSKADGQTAKMALSRLHIPKEVAEAAGIRDGTLVELVPEGGGKLIIRILRRPGSRPTS